MRTTQPRYNVTVALTKNEFIALQKLQEKKVKVIDIFRFGLLNSEKEEK